jgi:Spy/CpxP family protein refolding chaperone
MFRNLKALLCGTAMATAAGLSIAAWAMGPPEGMGHDPGRMLEHVAERLDLSAEQKVAVEGLVTQARDAGATDRERMRALRTELMGQRDNFDAAKAREISDEIGTLTGRMVYQASETWSQVYQLLSAEQRSRLDAMMKKRGGHRGKWRDDGEASAE